VTSSQPFDKKEAGNLLTENSTFGTVAHIIAYKAFGDEMYAMDPLELYANLEDEYRVNVAEDVQQKLQAILLATSTDAFFHDPEAFRAICNTLVEGDPGFLTFDDLTIPEILWSSYEVSLNHPGTDFSPQVQKVIDRELREEGPDIDSLEEAEDIPYFDRAVTNLREEMVEQLERIGMDAGKLPPI